VAENLSSDIVVIGAGAGGLTAAVAAAEKGAKVLLLESRNVLGGNAIFANGFLAAESDLQKRNGIEARPDELFKRMMAFSHWRLNTRLVRTLIFKSGETVDWLEEQGIKFELSTPAVPPGGRMPLIVFPFRVAGPGRTGAGVVKILVKRCEELGVQVYRNARAKHLHVSAGKISGVNVLTKDNREINIAAGAAVVSTGGFIANKELMKQLLPPFSDADDLYIGGLPHQGDGIVMAREIGAAIPQQAAYELSVNRFPWSTYVFLILKQPSAIWVNKYGERFADEGSFESNNTMWMQPGKITYTLFDEKIKQLASQQPLAGMDSQIVGDNPWPKFDDDLKLKVDTGRIKIADSWEEIAGWMGLAPEVLNSTIAEYNTGCESGNDFFGKEKKNMMPLSTPPYYAIRPCVNVLVTHGGIKINEHTEVIDTGNNVIPGLFAAGVETAGTDENVYGGLGGHSFGFSINSGRIAGDNAAGFVAVSH
jgi:fumarate reductase flavoprotein subunit